MSQSDFGTLSSPLTPTDFFNDKLHNWRNALHSLHSGSSRPSYAVAGTLWLDTTSTTPAILKLYDGADDISVGEFNFTTNVFTPYIASFSQADNAFEIKDNSDPTKKFVFQASSITAGQTRVLTVPDKDGTIAMLDDIVVGGGGLYEESEAFVNFNKLTDGGTTGGTVDGVDFVCNGSSAQVTVGDSFADLVSGTSTTGQAEFGVLNGFSSGGLLEATDQSVEFLAVIRSPSALSDGTNRYKIQCGLVSNVGQFSLEPNGAYFRYIDNQNSGKWLAVTKNGTETGTDTLVTVATSTVYVLKIEINAAGTEARFYINGSLVATNTGNFPARTNRSAASCAILKSAGSTSRTFRVSAVKHTCKIEQLNGM